MSLREYLRLLRHGKWWIAAGLLLGALGGLAFAATTVPTYVATTTLYFAAIEGGGEPGQVYQGALLAEQKARAYAQLIVTDRILDEVAFDTGAPVAPSAITIQSATGDPTLVVKVTDPSPQRAALVANTLADKSADLVAELERPNDPLLSTVTTVRLLAPANVPAAPASPILGVDVSVGALVGALLGLAAAVVRRNLDRSVHDRTELAEAAGLPVLGSLPYDRSSRRTPTLLSALPPGQLAESVRQLRVNLRATGLGDGPGGHPASLLVTSARAGEGKTSVACQLAAAFGLDGDRVLLIDADLRRPSVGRYLGIAPEAGLSTVLGGECSPDGAIESWGDGLFDVLVSGPIPNRPGELLGSARTAAVLAEYARSYDVVLIDSPAVLAASDASALARAGHPVLLVARHGRTPGPEIADAVAALRLVSARLIGSVLVGGPLRRRGWRWRADHPPADSAEPVAGRSRVGAESLPDAVAAPGRSPDARVPLSENA